MQENTIESNLIAAQSHRERGRVGRHGFIVKEMLDRRDQELNFETVEEID